MLDFLTIQMAPISILLQTMEEQHNQTVTIHPPHTVNTTSTGLDTNHAPGIDINILFQALTLALTVISLVIAYLQLWNMQKMGIAKPEHEENAKKRAR